MAIASRSWACPGQFVILTKMFKWKALWAFVPMLAIIAAGCQGGEEVADETDGVTVVTPSSDETPAAPVSANPGELEGTYGAVLGDLVGEDMLATAEAMIEILPAEEQVRAREELAEMRASLDQRVLLILADGNYTIQYPDEAEATDQTGTYTFADGLVTMDFAGNPVQFTHDPLEGTLRPVEEPGAPMPMPSSAVFRKQD